jgi:hypothetical protein
MKPRDSVSSSVTSYIDTVPDSVAYYWVTAVTQPGFESDYSKTLQVEPVPAVSRDVLLVYGTPRSDDDYVIDQKVRSQMEDILGDHLFDIYNWSDSNFFNDDCPDNYCVNWSDLARYSLIIFQEYPQSVILPQIADPANRLLTRLLESGRTVAYFGIPPATRKVSLSTLDTLIKYDSDNPANSILGIDSLSLQSWASVYGTFDVSDTLAGFMGAQPVSSDWPPIALGSLKDKVRGLFTRIFEVDSVLPFVPAFHPTEDSDVLYWYVSGFPNSSRLHGLPCGISSRRSGYPIYSFSFPLWSLDIESGRALVDRLIKGAQSNTPPSAASQQGLPDRFLLRTNYPNPFNSTTTIAFDLIYSQQVTLDVYNVRGARVRSLISNRATPPGVHQVSWDGRNDAGQTVASGIYFYRLHTDAGDAVRRMTLIK